MERPIPECSKCQELQRDITMINARVIEAECKAFENEIKANAADKALVSTRSQMAELWVKVSVMTEKLYDFDSYKERIEVAESQLIDYRKKIEESEQNFETHVQLYDETVTELKFYQKKLEEASNREANLSLALNSLKLEREKLSSSDIAQKLVLALTNCQESEEKLAQSKQSLLDMTTSLRDLKEVLRAQEFSAKDLESKLQASEERRRASESRLTASEERLKRTEERLSRTEEQLKDKSDKNRGYKDMCREAEAERDEYKTRLFSYEVKCNVRDSQARDLEEQLRALSIELAHTKTQLAEGMSRESQLSSQAELLRSQMTELASTDKSNKESQLRALVAEAAQSENLGKLSVCERRLRELQDRFDACKAEHACSLRQIASKDEELTRLESRCEEYQTKQRQLEEKLSSFVNIGLEFEAELSEWEAKLGVAADVSQSQLLRIDTLERALVEAEIKANLSQERLIQTSSHLTATKRALDGREEAETLARRELETQLSALHVEKLQQDALVTQLAEEVKRLRVDVTEGDRRRGGLEESLRMSELQCSVLTQKFADKELQVATTEELLAEAEEEAARSQREVEECRRLLADDRRAVEEAMAHGDATIEDLRVSLVRASNTAEDLQAKLSESELRCRAAEDGRLEAEDNLSDAQDQVIQRTERVRQLEEAVAAALVSMQGHVADHVVAALNEALQANSTSVLETESSSASDGDGLPCIVTEMNGGPRPAPRLPPSTPPAASSREGRPIMSPIKQFKVPPSPPQWSTPVRGVHTSAGADSSAEEARLRSLVASLQEELGLRNRQIDVIAVELAAVRSGITTDEARQAHMSAHAVRTNDMLAEEVIALKRQLDAALRRLERQGAGGEFDQVREDDYLRTIKSLRAELGAADQRHTASERELVKMQKRLDILRRVSELPVDANDSTVAELTLKLERVTADLAAAEAQLSRVQSRPCRMSTASSRVTSHRGSNSRPRAVEELDESGIVDEDDGAGGSWGDDSVGEGGLDDERVVASRQYLKLEAELNVVQGQLETERAQRLENGRTMGGSVGMRSRTSSSINTLGGSTTAELKE